MLKKLKSCRSYFFDSRHQRMSTNLSMTCMHCDCHSRICCHCLISSDNSNNRSRSSSLGSQSDCSNENKPSAATATAPTAFDQKASFNMGFSKVTTLHRLNRTNR
jgi:hypothetical protein